MLKVELHLHPDLIAEVLQIADLNQTSLEFEMKLAIAEKVARSEMERWAKSCFDNSPLE